MAMFAHSLPEFEHGARKRELALRPTGRRLLFAVVCGALGCSIGFGLATSWGRARVWAPEGECVAQFDHVSRPPLEVEGAVVTVTVTSTVQPPAASAVVGPETETDAERGQRPLLNGRPTAAFKDNLRPDVQYITTWPGSGWTNDVLLYMNLFYMAMITERVPVIPYFTPTHVGGSAPTIAFSEVFDLPRLEKAISTRILEWHQVKDPESEIIDPIGCWNVWQAVRSAHTEPHFNSASKRLGLDVSYTTAPRWIKMYPDNDGDPHATFWSLASLAFPKARSQNLQTPALSPIHAASLPPDEQMLCFDYLYYVGVKDEYEWDVDYSPAWRFVGRYMYWTPRLLEIAENYVREALATSPHESTPPYIAVHVRHGDFGGWCDRPLHECFAPLSAISRRVEEVKAELWANKQVAVERVVVTSDEKDPAWWDAVAGLGWARPDHSSTVERFGEWYPILIDAVIQSGALGFVGTDRSTVSIMAGKRVVTWHGGVAKMVRWGQPGADDH
ncbi:hypothetical protein DFH06DRAFT_1285110 [Mycena polygramma]|nr:hypothetical protein DFH06DRAFT_1285110 [Mycena polygramma]